MGEELSTGSTGPASQERVFALSWMRGFGRTEALTVSDIRCRPDASNLHTPQVGPLLRHPLIDTGRESEVTKRSSTFNAMRPGAGR